MENRAIPVCGEHHIKKEWRATTFEYKDEAITVRVPNVYAWVCPVTGEASYTPETVDELIVTVNELVELAKRAQKRRPALTEYTVSVGVPTSGVVYRSASANVAESSESYSAQSNAHSCDDEE
jgi:YgiT-type zinc finger domain-containing protein